MLLDAQTRERVAPLFEGNIGMRGVFGAHARVQERNPRAFDPSIINQGAVFDTTTDIDLAMDLLDYTVKPTPELTKIFADNPDAAQAFKKLAADMDHAAKITDARVQGAGACAVKRLGLGMGS